MTDAWHEVSVEELAAPGPNAMSTGPFGSAISSRFFRSSGVPVIRGSNLSVDPELRLRDAGLVFLETAKAAEFSRSVVRRGDLVFTCWGTINQVGLIDDSARYDEYVISNKQMKLTPDTNKAVPEFLYYLFSAPEMQREILDGAIGTGVPGFNLTRLRSLKLRIPSRPEQERIAEAMSDADSTAARLREAVTKKRDIKHGMMQELLTGRSRLPGFTRPWRSQALGEIATVTMGQSPPGASYNTTGVGMPLIQGNADVDGRRTFDRVWTTEPTKRVRAGDVVLTVRAPVGYTAVASTDACLGRGVCGLSAGPSTSFLFHALVGAEPSWSVLEQGSTFTAVNTAQVRTFAVSWPDDPDERSAIAEVLADADRELDALERRLAKARSVKHGMMQELLTGQTRLPAEGVAA